jgi:uncharacterized heparinase superfamily protein
MAAHADTPATYVMTSAAAVSSAAERWPARTRTIVDYANRAMAHEFDVLGSGPFTPIDPDRPARGAYRPIDWYLDPVRRLRFPRGVPHTEWKLYEMRPANADVKYPWELARCQHWVTLGQAFQLTRDERYAQEVVRQLADFTEANPVGIGINWTCTMDVALRVVNWVVALDLIRGSASLDTRFWTDAYSALFDHGVFIKNNLENTYEVTSNHFLSNVVGLYFLAAAFRGTSEGDAWLAFAHDALEHEMTVQVLPDGADFESAVPYHRLVTELFLGCLRLGDVTGRPLSDAYRGRVRDMVSYLAAVMRPDGLMPQAGDADDGRLHVMSGVNASTPQDARHLLGPAAMIFDNATWLACGGDAAAWEAAWWGFDVPQVEAASPPDVCHLFADAGHAVVRRGGHYLLVTNSIVGTKGFGNHKHNDQLSFEYHVHGVAVVVDPGSFVYTSDSQARNRFRGTAYHSTLAVDGREQNEMNPEWLFRLFESARAEHLSFACDGDNAVYRGRHTGYTRFPQPVIHERRFEFDSRRGRLAIEDVLHGAATHDLVWHFHFAPGVSLEHLQSTRCVLRCADVTVSLSWAEGLVPHLTEAFYSPSYGVQHACRALNLVTRAEVAASSQWRFTFDPEAA